ncbi:hypothetical protein ACFVGN_37785 [Streptomyces sp. NPDC057757]|uniref:hypothetical protein n=1 Tax=Streptomyces sp. NPDC057757 TaxID=3346241 RepID=UPI003698FC9A
MPDPSWTAQQQAQQASQHAQRIHQDHVRQHRDMSELGRAHARHGGAAQHYYPASARHGQGGGLRGLLTLLVLVAAVVYLARDPELRTTVETFAQDLWARVQNS